MSRVVVVGSINRDLVVRAPRFPLAGETILGRGFQTIPGGAESRHRAQERGEAQHPRDLRNRRDFAQHLLQVHAGSCRQSRRVRIAPVLMRDPPTF